MASILAANSVTVRYNDRVVLNNLTFAIDERDRIGMVGRNGSGKSTLLRIFAGLTQPDSGEVTRRRELMVGYLPQEFSLDPSLNVEQNVREGARYILDLIEQFENLPVDSARHHDIEHQIQTHDGWNLDTRLAIAMEKLNCPPRDRH